MKQINLFLLEKLKLNKDFKLKPIDWKHDLKWEDVSFPKSDEESNIVYIDSEWKKCKLPCAKYILFKDAYRGNRLHFADLQDFICGVIYAENDYENLDITKCIEYASNNLEEIMRYYFKVAGIEEDFPDLSNLDNINSVEECDDIIDWYNNNEHKFKGIDTLYVLIECLLGVDEYYIFTKQLNNINNNIAKILDSFGFDIIKK